MIRKLIMENVQHVIDEYTSRSQSDYHSDKVRRKKESCLQRKAEIVKVDASGKIHSLTPLPDETQHIVYDVHYKYLIKQGDLLYLEEEVENRSAIHYKDKIYEDRESTIQYEEPMEDEGKRTLEGKEERVTYHYDRLSAVQYAERWWNSYNPAYKKFENDCTNYISQCLHAGDAPMRGYPSKGQGWWMRNQSWSYSWTVANSMRWYIPNSTVGLRGRQVQDAKELKLGDVICYDFEGDGRFDHTTIVTGKDSRGEPLVNAHTFNSRMRYWKYEDSTAYTPNIHYRFFTIVDDS
ncbi:amidase domain-containing protein [Rossellomorea sp. AcN35-11]|nr:amidase domain-containing protein [Rossellomorea aquimaris]NMH69168.1 amidase domain-containing protein [Bacillus sp. RO3]WJV29397.1 amidase domain-containing protein [Rossellomorea sp. AcN35-11]